MNCNHQVKKKNQKKIIKKCKKFFIFSLIVINRVNKMQKAISDKIQLGETLNPARDYGGVSSINDEL